MPCFVVLGKDASGLRDGGVHTRCIWIISPTWLGSATSNHHGVAAFDFATLSGCDQLVVGPTRASGGTLELLMTDVRDLVWVSVVAPSLTQTTPLCRQSFQ